MSVLLRQQAFDLIRRGVRKPGKPHGITICDTLGAMDKKKDDSGSAGRLKRFAEIYREKMKARPYMELIARYDSMTEAGLLVTERVKADLYLDTHRFNELLYPEKLSIVANEN
jgi:hypothetical protein